MNLIDSFSFRDCPTDERTFTRRWTLTEDKKFLLVPKDKSIYVIDVQRRKVAPSIKSDFTLACLTSTFFRGEQSIFAADERGGIWRLHVSQNFESLGEYWRAVSEGEWDRQLLPTGPVSGTEVNIWTIAFSPRDIDGRKKLFALGYVWEKNHNPGGCVAIFDVDSGKLEKPIYPIIESPTDIAFWDEKRFFIATGHGGTIEARRFGSWGEVQLIEPEDNSIDLVKPTRIEVDQNNSTLWVASYNRLIQIPFELKDDGIVVKNQRVIRVTDEEDSIADFTITHDLNLIYATCLFSGRIATINMDKSVVESYEDKIANPCWITLAEKSLYVMGHSDEKTSVFDIP